MLWRFSGQVQLGAAPGQTQNTLEGSYCISYLVWENLGVPLKCLEILPREKDVWATLLQALINPKKDTGVDSQQDSVHALSSVCITVGSFISSEYGHMLWAACVCLAPLQTQVDEGSCVLWTLVASYMQKA